MPTEDKLRLTGHCTELVQTQEAELPELIRDAGGAARFAFGEFIHGQIRNPFTRKAYLHAVKRFSEWCAGRQLVLVRITPADVGRYLDSLTVSTPTRKLHLAALRRFFDELVMRHVVILNPALSVCTERHQAVEGKTPEISIEHARRLLKSIDVSHDVGRSRYRGSAPGPGDFLEALARIEVLGCRGVACNLAGNCGLWYCQTAGQKPSGDFQSSPMVKENRPAC